MFVDDAFDFYDIFEMHEYCDREDYDQAIQNWESDQESKRANKKGKSG